MFLHCNDDCLILDAGLERWAAATGLGSASSRPKQGQDACVIELTPYDVACLSTEVAHASVEPIASIVQRLLARLAQALFPCQKGNKIG